MSDAITLALLSAASFAGSHVASKRGLQGTSVTAAFMLIVGCAWITVSIPLFLDPPESISARAAVYFAISGLFAPAISRAAALGGVRALGPSVSVPIQQGLRPLIVVPAAVVMLGETIGLSRVIGLAAIVAGGWMLSREPDRVGGVPAGAVVSDRPHVGSPAPTEVDRRKRAAPWGFRRGIAFPIVAAVGYSTSDLLVKVGLGADSDPVYAAPVSIGTGFLVWTIAHAFPSVRSRFRLGGDAGWLVLSGALMGAAILLLFHALARGDVSLVAPVIGTQPLFVMVLSAMVLRNLEQREGSTILAATIVVIGTVLVSM